MLSERDPYVENLKNKGSKRGKAIHSYGDDVFD